jgi:hypothetical protein
MLWSRVLADSPWLSSSSLHRSPEMGPCAGHPKPECSHWSALPQAAGSGRANAPRRSHHALTVSKAAPVQAKVMVRQAAHASPGACRRVPPYLTSRPSARPASSGEFKIQFKLQQLSKILRNSKFCPKFMKLVLLGSFLIDLSSKNVKHTYMSHEIIR